MNNGKPELTSTNYLLLFLVTFLVTLACLVLLCEAGILVYILYKYNRQTRNSSQQAILEKHNKQTRNSSQESQLTATGKTLGIWTDVTGKGNEPVGNFNGVGTNQINWGIPNPTRNPEGKPSAYRFDGVESVPLPLNGTDFLLGTFTHLNYSIKVSKFSLVSARLKLILEIEDELKKEFIFLFQHKETPNRSSKGTPDIISISRLQFEERITIGGKEYSLSITGFCQDGEIVEQFTSLENQDNSTQLYGKLVETTSVLEPSLPASEEPPAKKALKSPSKKAVKSSAKKAVKSSTKKVIKSRRSIPVPTEAPPNQFVTLPQPLQLLIVTLSTSGVWSSVVEEVAGASNINGVGTNQMSWGISSTEDGLACAYRFDGMSTTSVPLQSSAFVLGTFIHYNYPISGYGIRAVTLTLTLTINGTNVEFNFQFAHQETINEGVNGVCPLTPEYAPPCPDVVSVVNLQSQETVTINDKLYVLYILGFLQNSQIVNQFITLEQQINSAQLFGQLLEVPSTEASVGSVTR